VIEEMLLKDLDAPRKQRHTIARIFHRLIEERGGRADHKNDGPLSLLAEAGPRREPLISGTDLTPQVRKWLSGGALIRNRETCWENDIGPDNCGVIAH
jgi:hypothetical protein